MNFSCNLLRILVIPITVNCGYSSKLLLFLVDGFRWDYFNLSGVRLDGFTRLFRLGSRAKYLTPEFPSNSFPNYKTIETGLHVENHGVVGNYMYDDETGEHFRLTLDNPGSFQPDWWNSAESFFITAEKLGIRTAVYYVRGCHLAIDKVTPTFCLPYVTYTKKEEIEWAIKDSLEKMRSDLADVAYIYHQNVDTMGHRYGPNSEQVKESVEEVDDLINDALNIIEENHQDDVNVIVVSDHGMTYIDYLHQINISETLDMDEINEITEGGAQAYVWPKQGKEKEVYNKLKDFHPHLKVYLRDDLLDRWFFKKHSRIPPIFLTTDKGWYLSHPKSSDRYFEITDYLWHGNHGYDNNDIDMRGIFAAYGPDFASNKVVEGFSIVNVYQLICHVTGIKPNPNNGTWSAVENLLVDGSKRDEL